MMNTLQDTDQTANTSPRAPSEAVQAWLDAAHVNPVINPFWSGMSGVAVSEEDI